MRRPLTLAFAVFALLVSTSLLLPVSVQAGTYLIEVNGQLPTDLSDRVAAAGGTLLRTHPEVGFAYASSDDPGFATALDADQAVRDVTADVVLQWTPLPDAMAEAGAPSTAGSGIDPTAAFFYPCQWNMRNIEADGAWALGEFGDPNVKVAVLDTGIDPTHQDLVGKVDVAQSASFLSTGSSPCNSVLGLPDEETIFDFRFHGTFVANQITTNGIGTAAVAPESNVVGVKVLNCVGSGSFGDIIAGILYAGSLDDVDVINMSLGVPGGLPKNAPGVAPLVAALNKAVNYAESQGKLVASASGNSGLDMDHSGNVTFLPAESGSGISVYATAWDDSLANYSNYGVSGTWVGAPGGAGIDPPPLAGCTVAPTSQGGVIGACSSFSIFFGCGAGNLYLIGGSGTSFASPIAAGVAALIDGQAGGALNGHQLATELANSADDLGKPGADIFFSHGRVNARKAVE